jgi:hypothetical protein
VPEGSNPFLNSAYGYRAYGDSYPDEPNRFERYSPNASNGCSYQMKDAPGFYTVIAARTYTLNLTFEGRLIDTRSGAQLASKTWTVVGQMG